MRRRYVYDPILKEMVEKGTEVWEEDLLPKILGDIEPYVSPIDGTVISSRSGLRDHMKRHDVVLTEDLRGQKKADHNAVRRRDTLSSLNDSFEHVRNQMISSGTWR